MKQLAILIMLSILPFNAIASAAPLGEASAAQAQMQSDSSPLVFIILPVENAAVMYEKFLPLKNRLEQAISRKIILKVARDYQEAIESIGTGKAHLAYIDPSAYCEAKKRYKIIPLAKAIRSGSSTYKSVIVTRKNSLIEKIVDVKGKRLALGNSRSSSSHLIPAVMFKEVGISLDDLSAVDYLELEDRIALSVLAGRHDLGGLSEWVAMKYLPDGLRIIKTSEAIPQYTLCASPYLSEEIRAKIKKALLSVSAEPSSVPKPALNDIEGFAPVQDRDFDVVRVMIKNLTGKNYLEYSDQTLKVAILPLYSAITLFDRFDPLMRYLSEKTGYEFKLVIPKDFEDFYETVKRREVEFSYSNPYIYIQLADKGHLKAIANTLIHTSGDIFRGIIITHRESAIKSLEDLKGKTAMVVSYKSAGGFLAQRLFLLENGIDVFKDLRLIEGKRQEEVILNVYRKTVDVGFVRESALDVLKEEIDLSRIRILTGTPYIANWPFAATGAADERIVALVQNTLLELKDTGVFSAARITGFKQAGDRDYDTLRKWIISHENR